MVLLERADQLFAHAVSWREPEFAGCLVEHVDRARLGADDS